MSDYISEIVREEIENWAAAFKQRHIAQRDDPEGVINAKRHNFFINSLGPEVVYYSALSRSLDSSLGNLVESIAVRIASENFEVTRNVEGVLYQEQITAIGALLERYKNSGDSHRPAVEHYLPFRQLGTGNNHVKRHDSDYVLKHRQTGKFTLIELKLGGDLDNKKARSEKEALLEQYCILSNSLDSTSEIDIKFATGYNRYGEGNPWKQTRVLQFFSEDELMISSDFWNFVADSDKGYSVAIGAYVANSTIIKDALREVKEIYLPNS